MRFGLLHSGLSLKWLEHPADNRKISGSNPGGPTISHFQEVDTLIAKIEFGGGTSVELVGSATDVSTVFLSLGVDTAQEEDAPALTKEELERLSEMYDDGYRWICRDYDGDLFVYDSKPGPIWSSRSTYLEIVTDDLFQAIKAPVCEPYEIKALLDSAAQKEEIVHDPD